MPDASHFVHYVTTADDHSNIHDNLYPRSDSLDYTDYDLVPRDWAESSGQGRVVSPPRSPLSVFPEDFQPIPPMSNFSSAPHNSMPTTYPPHLGGNSTNRAGLKRCVVKHEYQGSSAHGEVSLQVGQIYDVIPQYNSPCKNPRNCPTFLNSCSTFINTFFFLRLRGVDRSAITIWPVGIRPCRKL